MGPRYCAQCGADLAIERDEDDPQCDDEIQDLEDEDDDDDGL